jgi:hypothetical protein
MGAAQGPRRGGRSDGGRDARRNLHRSDAVPPQCVWVRAPRRGHRTARGQPQRHSTGRCSHNTPTAAPRRPCSRSRGIAAAPSPPARRRIGQRPSPSTRRTLARLRRAGYRAPRTCVLARVRTRAHGCHARVCVSRVRMRVFACARARDCADRTVQPQRRIARATSARCRIGAPRAPTPRPVAACTCDSLAGHT